MQSHAGTASLQVSAAEQECAEEVAYWATAVAAADGVHSQQGVQQGVIGACSSIRQPWHALPCLLEHALPHPPTDRVCPPPKFTTCAALILSQVVCWRDSSGTFHNAAS